MYLVTYTLKVKSDILRIIMLSDFFQNQLWLQKEKEEKKTRRLKSSKEGKKIRRPLNLQIQSYEAFHVIIKVFVTLQSKLPSL